MTYKECFDIMRVSRFRDRVPSLESSSLGKEKMQIFLDGLSGIFLTCIQKQLFDSFVKEIECTTFGKEVEK
jgi:hypothetical protein